MGDTKNDGIDDIRHYSDHVIHRCTMLCDDINMIFFIPAHKQASTFRYTTAVLDFLVITKCKESANKLQGDWNFDRAKQNEESGYTINLLILSENKFLAEYNIEMSFRKMLETVVVVYDSDAGLG